MSKLLDGVIKEMAAAGATGAGAIGGFRGSLFGGGVIDLKQARNHQKRVMKKIGYYPINENVGSDGDFDAADVFSKLDAAETRADMNKDTVAFGLEDDAGGIVKVFVKTEDSDEFESTLASMLAGVADEDDDDEISALEIAEVLFKLKDKFEIVDVEWGDVEGDEEEEQEIEGEGGGDPGPAGEAGLEGAEGLEDKEGGDELDIEAGMGGEEGGDELDLEADLEGDVGGEDAAKSALDSVIDMMKSDAEARKAEADARTAEARATEARYSAAASESKVRQEEEVIDMEAHNDVKKQKDAEAKKLADLAKYRHEKASGGEDEMGGDMDVEEEEVGTKGVHISKADLANLIFKNLRR